MYIEETGQGDGDIKITVEGDEYTAEANYDFDGDGIDETVLVMNDDGHFAYVDEDSDGRADLVQTLNSDGVVTEQARYEDGSGDWVSEDPGPPHGPPGQQGDGSMVIETAEGEMRVGPATEDTDADGRADTAIVETEDGSVLATDIDGDGSADQMVRVNDRGEVVTTHHTGDGEWTVVEEGASGGRSVQASTFVGSDDATWSFDVDPGETCGTDGKSDAGPSGLDSDSRWE
ncbi:DUF6802 family protein [Parasphingorhabdus pacifica]